MERPTVDGSEILRSPVEVGSLFRNVLVFCCLPGGAGFLPSRVVKGRTLFLGLKLGTLTCFFFEQFDSDFSMFENWTPDSWLNKVIKRVAKSQTYINSFSKGNYQWTR